MVARGVIGPPVDPVDDGLRDFRRIGAAGQKVFCAVDFGGFRQNRRTAMGDQQIHRAAQRRVGGDARITIRAAAIQTHDQMAGIDLATLRFGSDGQHGLDGLDAHLDRGARAADILDIEAAQRVFFHAAERFHNRRDLVHFATQTHKQDRRHIGLGGIAHQRAAQNVRALARRHAATQAVIDRQHAVDIRVSLERIAAIEVIGNCAHHGRRAVHRGDDADVVARADIAVRAHITLEGGRLGKLGRIVLALAESIIALEFAHRQVVHMDMPAALDVAGCKTDDLVVAAHRLALFDVARRHLVARRNHVAHAQALGLDFCARQELLAGDHDIVVRMQTDDEWGGHGVLLILP